MSIFAGKYKNNLIMKKFLLLCLTLMLPLTAIWADKTAYAIFDSTTGTMTFKYGEFTPDDVNSWDVSDTPVPSGPFPWELRYDGPLKHVVFDASFAEARPKSCAAWFDACNNLEDIKGLEYLNTSEVTNMDCMFEFCPKLTSLDLSHFNTSNVTSMSNMFAGTTGMETLDLSSFNTSKVTNMTYMFAGNPNGISKLKTIYVGDGWSTASIMHDEKMFDQSTLLTGGSGTTYSSDHIDSEYARIDAPGTPGYFTSSKMMGMVEFTDATVHRLQKCYKTYLFEAGLLDDKKGSAVRKINKPILDPVFRPEPTIPSKPGPLPI